MPRSAQKSLADVLEKQDLGGTEENAEAEAPVVERELELLEDGRLFLGFVEDRGADGAGPEAGGKRAQGLPVLGRIEVHVLQVGPFRTGERGLADLSRAGEKDDPAGVGGREPGCEMSFRL